MLFLIFAIAGLLTILLSVLIAKYADIISVKSTLNVVFVGLLLGGATSLPEITTSVTSIILQTPDLAVGNLIGSNLFNILIIAFWSIYFYKLRILNTANHEHIKTTLSVIALSTIITIALQYQTSHTLFGVGLDTITLVIFYAFFMYLLSKHESLPEKVIPVQNNYEHLSLKYTFIKFTIVALLIMLMGSILTITGDRIAILTGIGASFIGSFFIAASTSLPEGISCYVAIKYNNYKLALSSILGSNMFNIAILAGTDILYFQGNLFTDAHPIHFYSSIMTILLSVLLLRSLIKKRRYTFSYLLSPILIILLYIISTYIIFVSS